MPAARSAGYDTTPRGWWFSIGAGVKDAGAEATDPLRHGFDAASTSDYDWRR